MKRYTQRFSAVAPLRNLYGSGFPVVLRERNPILTPSFWSKRFPNSALRCRFRFLVPILARMPSRRREAEFTKKVLRKKCRKYAFAAFFTRFPAAIKFRKRSVTCASLHGKTFSTILRFRGWI